MAFIWGFKHVLTKFIEKLTLSKQFLNNKKNAFTLFTQATKHINKIMGTNVKGKHISKGREVKEIPKYKRILPVNITISFEIKNVKFNFKAIASSPFLLIRLRKGNSLLSEKLYSASGNYQF